MRIRLTTLVDGNFKEVFAQFDRTLFEYLLPSTGRVDLVEFGGSATGDIVHLEFIAPIKATWISEIVEHGSDEQQAWFVDRGTTLPFGLKSWSHRHIVRHKGEDHCEIIDDIEYAFANSFLTALFYPALYMAFYPRKHQYRQYFNKQ